MLNIFPVEIWCCVLDLLSPTDQACFALVSHDAAYNFGPRAWGSLQASNTTDRLKFLHRLDNGDMSYVICPLCVKFHRHASDCDSKYRGASRIKLPPSIGRLHWRSVQRLLRADRFQHQTTVLQIKNALTLPLHKHSMITRLSHLDEAEMIERNYKLTWKWSIKMAIFDGHDTRTGQCLFRIQSFFVIPKYFHISEQHQGPSIGSQSAKILGLRSIYDRFPYNLILWRKLFCGCYHGSLRNDQLHIRNLLVCALSHLKTHHFEADITTHPPPLPPSLCEVCGVHRRCADCASEYLIEINDVGELRKRHREDGEVPDFNPGLKGTRSVLTITRWVNAGDGITPFDGEWKSLTDSPRFLRRDPLPASNIRKHESICHMFEVAEAREAGRNLDNDERDDTFLPLCLT